MSDLSESSYCQSTHLSSALPWVAALAFFMQGLDTTILNTALPAMALDLHRSALAMEGTVISYAMTVALLIPLSGWLGDRFGTRRCFIWSVGLFTAGSLLCALSSSLPMLIVSRIVQGAGGAVMTPVGRLALLRSYSRSEYVRILSLVTLPTLLGPVLGPLLGGWLVTAASWHWVFLINLPVGVLGMMLARNVMPDFTAPTQAFDARGFVLFALGLVGVSFGLESLGSESSWLVVLQCVTGGVLLAGYVWHAARTENPLYSLALFRLRCYSTGLLGNVLTRLGTGGIALLLPLMLQVGFGESAQTAGEMMLPVALAAIAMNSRLPNLIACKGFRWTLRVSTVVTAFATASLALIAANSSLWLILPVLALFGAANAVSLVSGNTLAMGDLPADLASQGNSLIVVSQQLSISLGVACASSVLNLFRQPHMTGGGLTPAFHATYLVLAVMTFLSAGVFLRLRPADGTQLSHSVPVAAEH